MDPLITVMIPMYNTEKYVKKCITSLFNQTYKNIEIIVVDDGSTDNSLRICENLAKRDHRLKILHQENRGVSAARNIALNESQGDYLVFVDSDDYVRKNYIRNLYRVICESSSDISINKYTTNEKYNFNLDSGKIMTFDADEAITKMLLGDSFDSSVCCKMFRRHIVESIRFSENLIIAEDMLFFYELLNRVKKVSFSDNVGYYYMKHENGAISLLSDEKIKSMEIFEKLISDCPQKAVKEALISKYLSTCFHLLSLNNCKNFDVKTLEQAIKKYRIH